MHSNNALVLFILKIEWCLITIIVTVEIIKILTKTTNFGNIRTLKTNIVEVFLDNT